MNLLRRPEPGGFKSINGASLDVQARLEKPNGRKYSI